MVIWVIMLKISIFDDFFKVNILLIHDFKCTILLENTPAIKGISSFMMKSQFSDRNR